MIGIIGGSGLEDPKILRNPREKNVKTPYGKTSSPITLGKISGIDVAILARHGKKNTIPPSKVPFRANLWALKKLGCNVVLASTACGSLREEIKPGDLVFPDQFIDHTKHRIPTFYDKDKVCHIPMDEPFCGDLRKILIESAKELKLNFHPKGTVITIEGPRFSTRAESHMFRQWGADVINMSTVPEVVLARELGICYQAVAMATDYDCWKEAEQAVDIESVMRIFRKNAENVKKLFVSAIPKSEMERKCRCPEDIKKAVIQ